MDTVTIPQPPDTPNVVCTTVQPELPEDVERAVDKMLKTLRDRYDCPAETELWSATKRKLEELVAPVSVCAKRVQQDAAAQRAVDELVTVQSWGADAAFVDAVKNSIEWQLSVSGELPEEDCWYIDQDVALSEQQSDYWGGEQRVRCELYAPDTFRFTINIVRRYDIDWGSEKAYVTWIDDSYHNVKFTLSINFPEVADHHRDRELLRNVYKMCMGYILTYVESYVDQCGVGEMASEQVEDEYHGCVWEMFAPAIGLLVKEALLTVDGNAMRSQDEIAALVTYATEELVPM